MLVFPFSSRVLGSGSDLVLVSGLSDGGGVCLCSIILIDDAAPILLFMYFGSQRTKNGV